jgi:hypothetical protein
MSRHLGPVRPIGAVSTKRAAFKKVVEPRISNAVHDLYLVSLCADRSRYDFTDEDRDYVVEELRHAFEDCVAKYMAGTKKRVIKLPD